MPHGMMFCARADEYSDWKLNGVPEQSTGLVFMKPLAAEAIMKPLCPVLKSVSFASSAWPPPGIFALNMLSLITSPGFISRVCAFGVTVVRSLSCGLGGPVGTPLVWIQPKLTGSVQFGLQVPSAAHSRLSMVSAEHQCVLSQLMLSAKGAKPGA